MRDSQSTGRCLVGAWLLIVGSLTAVLAARLRLPAALLFLAVGMLIDDDGLDWMSLADPALVQALGVGALVIILFEGGLTTDARRLRRGAAPGIVLATVGVLITAGVTALGAMWLLGVPSRVAWLVGAIVASTDAAAVFDLLRRAPLPERLSAVLKIESGANDPIAVLLTVGLLSAWSTPPSAAAWIVFGAAQLIGGVAAGVAAGWSGGSAVPPHPQRGGRLVSDRGTGHRGRDLPNGGDARGVGVPRRTSMGALGPARLALSGLGPVLAALQVAVEQLPDMLGIGSSGSGHMIRLAVTKAGRPPWPAR